MEAAYLECPAGKDALARLADTVLVVQGKEFLAHAAILGRESQALAQAFSTQRGTADLGGPPGAGYIKQEQKRVRLMGASEEEAGFSAGGAQAGLIRLEEPFQGFNAPEVEFFIWAVYQPERLQDAVIGKPAHFLAGVIRLAHFLNAKRVLERIAAALLAGLPSSEVGATTRWGSLLELADKVQTIMPAFYESMLEFATRSFGASLLPGVDKVTPFQQLAGMEMTELSQGTWRALMLNSLAIGRHLVHGTSMYGAVDRLQSYNAKPLALLPSTAGVCTYEWDWEPPANFALGNSEQLSPPFFAANCEWQLVLRIPKGHKGESKVLHLCLQPKSSGCRVAYRMVVSMTAAITDSQGREYKQSELLDARKGYLRDGKLRIRVELEDVNILDA